MKSCVNLAVDGKCADGETFSYDGLSMHVRYYMASSGGDAHGYTIS